MKKKEVYPSNLKGRMEKIPEQEKEKVKPKIVLKWRPLCKSIAYVDMNLITIGLPVAIVNVVMSINASILEKHGLECLHDDGDGWNKIVCAIAVAVLISISDVGVWAARNLMNSTEPGQDLNKALRMAGIWKLVSFFFMTFTFIGMVYTQNYVTGVFILLWHSALIYMVSLYTQELKETIAKLNSYNSNGKEKAERKQFSSRKQMPSVETLFY